MGDPEELLEECEEHVETHLSLEAAKKAAEKDLPRDGDEQLWRLSAPRASCAARPRRLAYFSYLEAITYVFLALLLISTSNIVSNVSGGYYNRDELGLQSWLFAVTSVGNAVALSPAYGASEFVCAMLMVVFLYKGKAALEEEVESAEAAEVTAADFAVMLDGVPGARCVKPEDHASFVRGIERALNDFVGADESHSSLEPDVANRPLRVKCIVPALDQREIILLAAEHSAHNANLDAIEADIKVHPTANKPEQTRSISRRFTALPAPKRGRGNAVFKHLGETTRSLLEKEEEERKKDDSCEEKLAAHVRKGTWDRCAGVVFVSFADQHDADRVLKRASRLGWQLEGGRGRLVRSVSFDLPTPRGARRTAVDARGRDGAQRAGRAEADVPEARPLPQLGVRGGEPAARAVGHPVAQPRVQRRGAAVGAVHHHDQDAADLAHVVLRHRRHHLLPAGAVGEPRRVWALLPDVVVERRHPHRHGPHHRRLPLRLPDGARVGGARRPPPHGLCDGGVDVPQVRLLSVFGDARDGVDLPAQHRMVGQPVLVHDGRLHPGERHARRPLHDPVRRPGVERRRVHQPQLEGAARGDPARDERAVQGARRHLRRRPPADGDEVCRRRAHVQLGVPILYGVVVAVAFTAKFLDRYNVLRVLIDMRKTDESVRAIFRFVLPIAIVMHCYTASTLFDDLHTGTDIMTNYTVYEAFNQAVIRCVT